MFNKYILKEMFLVNCHLKKYFLDYLDGKQDKNTHFKVIQ